MCLEMTIIFTQRLNARRLDPRVGQLEGMMSIAFRSLLRRKDRKLCHGWVIERILAPVSRPSVRLSAAVKVAGTNVGCPFLVRS